MGRSFAVAAVACCVWIAQACGSSDDSGLNSGGDASAGSGGSTAGGSSGSGGSGGTAAGGSAGTSSGGNGGASAGGSAGEGTGGSAGASTGGSAGEGTGGSAGEGTGGSGGAGENCPSSEPTQNAPCAAPGRVCCYGPDPAKPWRCVPTNVDGGGPYVWKSLVTRVCCPTHAPQVGSECKAPGDLKCCYDGGGFFCNGQPEPDVWATASCN